MDNFMKIPTKKNFKEKFFIYFHDEMENYGNLITFEIIMFFCVGIVLGGVRFSPR
jgi:hypothetical protein